MLNRRVVVTFLLGIVFGAVLALVAAPLARPRLPQAIGGGGVTLDGAVASKQRQEDRLLLTVVTQQGAAILATFKRRISEVALLVEIGDSLTLAVPRYQPFMEDPQIVRVAKGGAYRPTGETEIGPEGAAEPDTLPADTIAADTTAADTTENGRVSRWY